MINVVWLSYHDDVLARGYWDQAMLEDAFSMGDYEHHSSTEKPDGGAVVVINGRTHIEDSEKINAEIAKLVWCLFIITGDEEAKFPWREIKHPNMRVWVQLPRMNQHDDVFRMPNGYRPETRKELKAFGQQERIHDWSFVGQVTHERRRQCAEELRKLSFGELVETDVFGSTKVPYDRYIKIMAQSKVVPCPSGPETPDSFRLYEALEAGCIPVVDAFSSNHKHPGFWRYLFGDDIPFPIIDYWDKFPALLPELLKDYPENANRVFAWWMKYKRKFRYKLEDDIRELSK